MIYPRIGFGHVLMGATVLAILTGFALLCWRSVERDWRAERANTILHRWGAAARLHAAEELVLHPGDTRPTWSEVEERSKAWYNALPPYQGARPLATYADRAGDFAAAFDRDRRRSLDEEPTGMHFAPGADYSEPGRWAQRPIFAFAWNEKLGSPVEAIAAEEPRVLVFEGLTHRADTPGHERRETREVGHSLGGPKQAADRYRLGTGAILTDGSLRRADPTELPW